MCSPMYTLQLSIENIFCQEQQSRPRISFDNCDTIEPPVQESLDVPSLLCSHSEVSDCETWPEGPGAPPEPDDEDGPEPDGPADMVAVRGRF